MLLQECAVSGEIPHAAQLRLNALSGHGTEVLRLRDRNALLGCLFQYSLRQRMLRLFFQSRRQPQKLLRGNAVRRKIRHNGLSLGQRAGLVHNHRRDLVQFFK